MTNVAALNFRKELAEAEVIAAERRRTLEEAPELTAEEILAGFKRELRSVTIEGFGKVYYYYPMSISDHLALQEKIAADGTTTAAAMVQAIIDHARTSDGALKFKQEHAPALLDAPPAAVARLASTLVSSLRFTVASAEKK